jgi:hypothetical protein
VSWENFGVLPTSVEAYSFADTAKLMPITASNQTGSSNLSETSTSITSAPINLDFMRESVDDAQCAINELWESTGKTFWRSTVQRERESDKGYRGEFYPTVTLRCVDSLLLLAGEAPSWTTKETVDALRDSYVPAIASRTIGDLRTSSLNTSVTGTPNVFTLSIYIQTFSRLLKYRRPNEALLINELTNHLIVALNALLSHSNLAESHIGSLHPFIAYRVKRALSDGLLFVTEPDSRLQMRSLSETLDGHFRQSVARILAKEKLGSLNPSEAVALAFCAAGLVNDGLGNLRSLGPFVLREDFQLVRTALSVCFRSQDATGCWPLGRVVEEDKDITSQRLEVTTFEVATVVAEAAIGLLRGSSSRAIDPVVIDGLARSLQSARYAERSIVRMDTGAKPRLGWCSDHAYGSAIIESWTSATVLESFVRLGELVQEFNRRAILATFVTVNSEDRDWPSWLRWTSFKSSSEVDYNHPILDYLDRKVVSEIQRQPRGLPSAETRTVSILLFGPPGTSKTTIAKGVAEGLRWPVVLLNPGNFIERGLEYIETQAKSVFDRLIKLSRAVVIFDECDELFRDRKPRPESEQTRGITAFVTASMLPKLQELHDRGQVVFFVCTNNFYAVDPAVKRGGRIDHVIGVGPPDKRAREKIVGAIARSLRASDAARHTTHLKAALDELVNSTERFTRLELERTVGLLFELERKSKWKRARDARQAAAEIIERQREGLTITLEEYNRFIEDRKKYSHAHLEGLQSA